jgi:hypothetical protein
MPQLNSTYFRRDYTGEPVTFVEDGQMKSLYVNPREFPHDRQVSTAIVLGNGISRTTPEIKLIVNQNNRRVAEGYKTTYACNAAYRDTPADYYIVKDRIFFSEIPVDKYNKMFVSNDMWVTYRDTNLIPYVYYMDSGSTGAYLAAFDGHKKIFLIGFDGSDNNHNLNVYANSLGYERNDFTHEVHNAYLYDVCRVYSSTQFYRVRTHHSYDFSAALNGLPNYQELSVRDAILAGDF